MLGFGFVIGFDRAPIDFRAAPWIVPVVQALVALPFVVRIVAPTLRAIDQRQREAAAMLGASPGRVRREIDLPIVGRALAVAAGFAFAISLGEFGATVFLARPDTPTLPVAIFRFLGRPGEINCTGVCACRRAHGIDRDLDFAVGRLRVGRGWARCCSPRRSRSASARVALAGVTLEVARDEVVTVLGASGPARARSCG